MKIKDNLQKLRTYLKTNFGKIIKGAIPYVIGVSVGVTTFFLFNYFNRDIVNVESIVVGPQELSFSIDRKLAEDLKEYVGSGFQREFDLSVVDGNFVLDALTKLNTESQKLNDEIVLMQSQRLKLYELKDKGVTYEELEKLGVAAYANRPWFLGRIYEEDTLENGKVDINNITEQISDDLKMTIKNKETVDSIITRLGKLTKNALDKEKDKFQLEVIAFNEGNQQTVLRYKGLLKLGTTQLVLKRVERQRVDLDGYASLSKAIVSASKKEEQSANYIIVQPKSYVVLTLDIEVGYNNKPRDIEAITREYISGQENAQLILFDIKDRQITPFEFRLQSDLGSDPNDELNQYIDKNLSSFVEK